ncbi:hypothetical protein Ciccas_003693 [Cichlidogyrus casuarinus]|uniref:Uncharacterized protein n=1 Tax=Cichlidogyrus casuarinus TaxID=1844966 RepID=A0ABD2QDP0_9PLAT
MLSSEQRELRYSERGEKPVYTNANVRSYKELKRSPTEYRVKEYGYPPHSVKMEQIMSNRSHSYLNESPVHIRRLEQPREQRPDSIYEGVNDRRPKVSSKASRLFCAVREPEGCCCERQRKTRFHDLLRTAQHVTLLAREIESSLLTHDAWVASNATGTGPPTL